MIQAPTNLRLVTAGVYPTGSSGSYSTAARLRLAWDHDPTGSTGVITFRVQVDNGSLVFSLAGTTTTLELDVSGLPIHAARTVEVRAETAVDGNSAYIQLPILTSDPVPSSTADVPAVVNLAAALVTDTSVLLTWEYAGFVTTGVTLTAVSSDGGAGVSQTVSGLEKSMTVTGLTAGKTYTFDVSTFTEFALTTVTLQGYGGTTASAFAVMADVDDDAPISGPATLELEVGVPVAGNWAYIGSGAVESWSLAGAPTGIGDLLTPTVDNRLAQLDGAPTVDGVFAASLNVRSQIGYVRSASRYPVKVLVTGRGLGGCLAWYHGDSDRIDLQVDERLRDVYSYASPVAGENRLAELRLMRGEKVQVHVIPRDSGGNFITTAFLELGVTIRLKDRRDGPILFTYYHVDAGGDMPVATIGGHVLPYVDLDLEAPNPILDQLFTNLNRNPAAEPAGNALDCELELTMKLTGGRMRTSKPVPVLIAQDIDR